VPEISAALSRAIKRGDARFVLFECDHPAGFARYWSRTGNLVVNGNNYFGLGVLGNITGATRSVNLAINEVTFEMRGVSPTAETFLAGLVRNRTATATLGAMSKNGRATIDDDPMIEALLDYQRLSVDPKNGSATLKLIGQQGFVKLDQAQDLAWSDQQQRSEFPTDCGMALTHLWVDRDSNWRAS
jgi:hypothetical protein